jgi:hypothetical protein
MKYLILFTLLLTGCEAPSINTVCHKAAFQETRKVVTLENGSSYIKKHREVICLDATYYEDHTK